MINADKLDSKRRKNNFVEKAKEKYNKFMERFTIDAENERRKIYNARVDAGKAEKKVSYLNTYKGTRFDK